MLSEPNRPRLINSTISQYKQYFVYHPCSPLILTATKPDIFLVRRARRCDPAIAACASSGWGLGL